MQRDALNELTKSLLRNCKKNPDRRGTCFVNIPKLFRSILDNCITDITILKRAGDRKMGPVYVIQHIIDFLK
jgi:hypothetical protein